MPATEHGLECAPLNLTQCRLSYVELFLAAYVELYYVPEWLYLRDALLFVLPGLFLGGQHFSFNVEALLLLLELLDFELQVPVLVLYLLLADLVVGDVLAYLVLPIFQVVDLLQELLLAGLEVLDLIGKVLFECCHLVNYPIVLRLDLVGLYLFKFNGHVADGALVAQLIAAPVELGLDHSRSVKHVIVNDLLPRRVDLVGVVAHMRAAYY